MNANKRIESDAESDLSWISRRARIFRAKRSEQRASLSSDQPSAQIAL
ncbi:MAG: hypothetical protein NZM06_02095 [Chloroherpetonaceae bacterium]|nr:hypothetical protein [Chloroherpetonaceae bacterium]